MEDLLDEVSEYWQQRAIGYCHTNVEELESYKREAWLDLINEYSPTVLERKLRVLDIGTGPGFLAIIMAGCGHEVTAVDYTPAMLAQAKHNAIKYKQSITFARMDAHKLHFADNMFDLIITRNLTWNLERPDKAYKEWYRILTSGGRVLNFDANWYLHVHDTQKKREYEQDRLNARRRNVADHYVCKDTKKMEDIAKRLPLSSKQRPQWDVQELMASGFRKIMIEREIGNRVWDEVEKINYASTPMFMVGAEK